MPAGAGAPASPNRSAPDLVNRDFDPERADQVWAADVTQFWTAEGWLYFAGVIDLAPGRHTSDLVKILSARDRTITANDSETGLRAAQVVAADRREPLKSVSEPRPEVMRAVAHRSQRYGMARTSGPSDDDYDAAARLALLGLTAEEDSDVDSIMEQLAALQPRNK